MILQARTDAVERFLTRVYMGVAAEYEGVRREDFSHSEETSYLSGTAAYKRWACFRWNYLAGRSVVARIEEKTLDKALKSREAFMRESVSVAARLAVKAEEDFRYVQDREVSG